MTARDLIKGSLRLIGAIATGENPSAAEEVDALASLNGMLDAWSVKGFLIYQNVREVFPFVGGQATYTVGPTGNFNTTRPLIINKAMVLYADTETELEILTSAKYAEISDKSIQSNIPEYLYCDGGYPLENYSFYPVPSEANSVVIYSKKILTNIANASDELNLPPGYERALRYNLALEIAPEYGRDPSAIVAKTAMDSIVELQRQNTEAAYLTSDAFGLSSRRTDFNILSGDY